MPLSFETSFDVTRRMLQRATMIATMMMREHARNDRGATASLR
jgi:hypothetical protein